MPNKHRQPKYTAIISIPVFAETEEQALERIMPYVRDMRVQYDPIQIVERNQDECNQA